MILPHRNQLQWGACAININGLNMKSIFITGAASGIGKATACLFLEKGWFVGLYDRDDGGLTQLVSELDSENICYMTTDTTDTQQVMNAVQHFSGFSNGKMDLLFNCAGILHMGYFEEVDIAKHIDIVQVNLVGSLNCIHSALPLLSQTAGAQIVNMSSASAIYGTPELSTYSATKFAIKGLTEALNLSFERLGIHVCDVMVPYVQTPLLNRRRQALSIEKLGVNITPQQVAGVIWKTTLRRKVHWTLRLKHLLFLVWLFPFIKKTLMKHYSGLNRNKSKLIS